MSTPSLTWVIGARGLLGQHVQAATALPFAGPDIPWSEPQAANMALRQGIQQLIGAAGGDRWAIAWCAGRGVTGATEAELALERSVFATFVDDLAAVGGVDSGGVVFFASSAGGVYAGSTEPPFTEASAPSPRSPYGETKLAMEGDLRGFADRTRTPCLIGRIANLYGPGQDLTKRQGLVSHLCLATLTQQPLHVYVPLDTMRDYIYVSDCAAVVVAGLEGVRARLAVDAEGHVVTKILASGRSTTVAGLLGESTRLFRRRPRVVQAAASPQAAAGQVHDLRLRSVRWPELDQLVRTALPIGLAATAADVSRRLRELPDVPLARGHEH